MQNPPDLESFPSKLKSAHQQIAKANQSIRIMSEELARQKRRSKAFKKIAMIAGAPVLAVILPIMVIFYFIPKNFRHLLLARALGVNLFHKRLKTTVRDAYIIYHMAGYERALDDAKRELARNPRGVSPGTTDLFNAMDAKTDVDWLLAMNAWAKASGKTAISLDDGDQDRFLRISFEPLPTVDSPHLITVIMPCYNCAETVTKAVQSILNQTWRNIEIIAVDDASTDNTFTILTDLAKQDPRLRVLKNTLNVGPYVSKNRALTFAKGEYITGHDSDDLAFPDRLALQMAPILADATCKGTIGYSMRVTKFGTFCQPGSGVSIWNYDGALVLASISLLLERKTFDTLFGFWDSVRVSADTEILERAFDAIPKSLKLVTSCGNFLLSHDASLTQDISSGLSLVSGFSNVRRQYKNAFRIWHKRTNKFKRQLAFPPNSRPFEVPEIIEVPLRDILELIKDDRPENTKP